MDDGPPVSIHMESPGLRLSRFRGILDDERLVGAYASLLDAPDYQRHCADLVDLTAVEQLAVTSAGLARLVSLLTARDPDPVPTRLAIVAAADAVYGMARMFEMLRGTPGPAGEIRVFRGLEDARRWLEAGSSPA